MGLRADLADAAKPRNEKDRAHKQGYERDALQQPVEQQPGYDGYGDRRVNRTMLPVPAVNDIGCQRMGCGRWCREVPPGQNTIARRSGGCVRI
jgi:hypothetical protein